MTILNVNGVEGPGRKGKKDNSDAEWSQAWASKGTLSLLLARFIQKGRSFKEMDDYTPTPDIWTSAVSQ